MLKNSIKNKKWWIEVGYNTQIYIYVFYIKLFNFFETNNSYFHIKIWITINQAILYVANVSLSVVIILARLPLP